VGVGAQIGLPPNMRFKLVEPLRELFKDRVIHTLRGKPVGDHPMCLASGHTLGLAPGHPDVIESVSFKGSGTQIVGGDEPGRHGRRLGAAALRPAREDLEPRNQ
jgi:hypothetical protein